MERFELNSLLHLPGLIEFSWNDIGGTYHVYRNQILLYQGTMAKFKDNNLSYAGMYTYSIERVENEQVLNVIALQTSAYNTQCNLENPLQSLVFSTIVTNEKIVLSWEEIEEVDEYYIYKDKEFVTVVKTNQYTDYTISLDQSYVYTILSKRPLAKSEERLSRIKSVFTSTFGAINPFSNKEKAASEEFRMMKLIGKPNILLTPTLEKQPKININEWKFRYTTFLKNEWMKNPNILALDHYFKGDGRDFDVESKGFRTRVDIRLDYSDEKKRLKFTREVGETLSYNRAKKFRKKGVASYDGIKLAKLDYEEQEVGFILNHSAGNPLVTAPKIDYEVQTRLKRDGSFDITGFHNQAPYHEVYVSKESDESWLPIHLAESKGLSWMSDVFARQYWRYLNFE